MPVQIQMGLEIPFDLLGSVYHQVRADHLNSFILKKMNIKICFSLNIMCSYFIQQAMVIELKYKLHDLHYYVFDVYMPEC